MSDLIPLQCPWCPTGRRVQGLDAVAQHALAKHPEQLSIAGGLTPAAARKAAAVRIVELYPSIWQAVRATDISGSVAPAFPLSAANSTPVILEKSPYSPRTTPARTAAAIPTVAAPSAPAMSVAATPTTPAAPINASINPDLAKALSGVMASGSGASAANASPWGPMHQQQQRPISSSPNPPVTIEQLSSPATGPAAGATSAFKSAFECLQAAAGNPQSSTSGLVTSAAVLAPQTPLAAATAAAPTLSSLLRQALAQMPLLTAGSASVDPAKGMSDLLSQLASHVRASTGPTAVTAAAPTANGHKPASSSLAPTAGAAPSPACPTAAPTSGLPHSPFTPAAAAAAGAAAAVSMQSQSATALAKALDSAGLPAALSAGTMGVGPAGSVTARITDPNSLGQMAGLSQEVLQVLYNNLDHQCCRNMRVVNKYFANKVLQHRVQQQGRLAVCVAALRRLLSTAEAADNTARQSSAGLGAVQAVCTAVDTGTHATAAAAAAAALLQALTNSAVGTSSVEAVVASSSQQSTFAVNATVWEGSRTYDLADICRNEATNQQHIAFLEDKLSQGVSSSSSSVVNARQPASSDVVMQLQQQDVLKQLLSWLQNQAGVAKSIGMDTGSSCNGPKIMIHVYLVAGGPTAAGAVWEGLTSSQTGLLEFLEKVLPSHAVLSIEVQHTAVRHGTAAAVIARYGHAKFQGKGN